MSKFNAIPRYQGQKWLQIPLPDKVQSWPLGKFHSSAKDSSQNTALKDQLQQLHAEHPWKWPKKPVLFFSDLHADSDAFIASLVASGGIKKTGAKNHQFKLTDI